MQIYLKAKWGIRQDLVPSLGCRSTAGTFVQQDDLQWDDLQWDQIMHFSFLWPALRLTICRRPLDAGPRSCALDTSTIIADPLNQATLAASVPLPQVVFSRGNPCCGVAACWPCFVIYQRREYERNSGVNNHYETRSSHQHLRKGEDTVLMRRNSVLCNSPSFLVGVNLVHS